MVGVAYALDIDGAGRSSMLACLPTARGTVAPTRGQVPGRFGRSWLVFSRLDPRGSGGSRAPLCKAISGPGSLRARSRGQATPPPPKTAPKQEPAQQGLQHLSGPFESHSTQLSLLKFHSRHPSQLLAPEMFKDSLTSK